MFILKSISLFVPESNRTWYGDIFLTLEHLYFVAYTSCTSTRTLENPTQVEEEKRNLDYGSTIQQRCKKRKFYIVLNRQTIEDINISKERWFNGKWLKHMKVYPLTGMSSYIPGIGIKTNRFVYEKSIVKYQHQTDTLQFSMLDSAEYKVEKTLSDWLQKKNHTCNRSDLEGVTIGIAVHELADQINNPSMPYSLSPKLSDRITSDKLFLERLCYLVIDNNEPVLMLKWLESNPIIHKALINIATEIEHNYKLKIKYWKRKVLLLLASTIFFCLLSILFYILDAEGNTELTIWIVSVTLILGMISMGLFFLVNMFMKPDKPKIPSLLLET